MNWTIAGVAVAVIGTIWAIVSGMSNSIEKQIQKQMNDPDFIKKVAEKVRLPFIIFDEDATYLNNSGGEEYIESIQVTKKDNGDIDEIVIICKKFLESAPIIQSIDEQIQFHQPERTKQTSWKVTAFQDGQNITIGRIEKGPRPLNRFKIEIIP